MCPAPACSWRGTVTQCTSADPRTALLPCCPCCSTLPPTSPLMVANMRLGRKLDKKPATCVSTHARVGSGVCKTMVSQPCVRLCCKGMTGASHPALYLALNRPCRIGFFHWQLHAVDPGTGAGERHNKVMVSAVQQRSQACAKHRPGRQGAQRHRTSAHRSISSGSCSLDPLLPTFRHQVSVQVNQGYREGNRVIEDVAAWLPWNVLCTDGIDGLPCLWHCQPS